MKLNMILDIKIRYIDIICTNRYWQNKKLNRFIDTNSLLINMFVVDLI